MKRFFAIMMAAMMMVGTLTACSGTMGMDNGQAYGSVTTTPNGSYNGYGGYNNGSNGGVNSYNGYNNGTGMTGGQ